MSEAEIRREHEAGNMQAAATAALETYGGEIYGYLVATLRDDQEATEVFSDLCEDLWRGLPDFAWRASCRTWLYTLARHAAARHRRAPHRRPERNLGTSALGDVADRIRSETLAHRKSEVKDAFAELRRKLELDDQTLLILRIDRRMSWSEIAEVLDESGDPKRAAARVRKRFQLLKDRLRTEARRAGLMS